jgi:isoleucyl-tRNA synthetase
MAPDFKDTLLLPRTDFPMRAGLPQREPERAKHWDKMGLYDAIQNRRESGEAFILHDGPPFTNGDVHIGTALNKTLKDVIVRYKSMRGFRAPYVPGWDCHGLPIEQKVARVLQDERRTVSTAELRGLCDAFSESWIAIQRTQFRRLGVLADWKNEYKTKDPAYEADILRTFAAFIEKGLVYRSKKPVYWSIPFETALAEAEIEYKEHSSPSVWVKFPVPAAEAGKFGLPADKPLGMVIWTTTPWTLPANLAIAVHPQVGYAAIDRNGEYLVVAEALAEKFLKDINPANQADPSPAKVIAVGKGAKLEHLQARHSFIDRASPVVLADYVTTESGTGCVHTAPGHGVDDYLTGLKYKLEIYCPVGGDGRYLDDGRVPADLVGLTTLETVEDLAKKRTSPANIGVLKKLAATGALVAKKNITHSYPHCWRSKTPIVFRAVDQWFVSLDQKSPASKAAPRHEALNAIDQVRWIPAWGEARIRGAVESRPDWCISRQRAWGVPIPAFYDENKGAYLDAGVVCAIADKIEKLGTRFWYDAAAEQILEGVSLPPSWPSPSALTCGRDTLDVWFDSGSSHAAVLKRHRGKTQWPADLYLEGSDQHRGWFQSSLWTSVVRYGLAPYRQVLTHGFIVDEERKKISKSSAYERPQTSDSYIAEYGADVVRLWIASQDFRDDIPISKEILSHVGETYRLIRNTFRFQLSNLFDFEHARDAVQTGQMDALDRWALHQTAELIRGCAAAYDACEFHRVYQLCNQFCSVVLSATYHDILKDRLYTLAAGDRLRRSSQTAIHHIFRTLTRLLSPIISFTADEAWSFGATGREYADDSVHLQDWPVPAPEWTHPGLDSEMSLLLRVRSLVNQTIEPLRAASRLGKSLDAAVTLRGFDHFPLKDVLKKHIDGLPELFIVSQVDLELGDGADTVQVRHCRELGHERCPRCWRWVPALESIERGVVCPRCVAALRS